MSVQGQTPPPHGGIGESIKRKEDGRFLVGRGNYLDDVILPRMLHMVILRSPHAHARIRSIDTSAAGAAPGVIAVVTGELMAQHKLAWMPTLSGDTQAVLATDKVRFQGQEVAAVVAESKYAAEDAVGLIQVDYDVLPAVTSPRQAQEAGAPVIRDDKEGQKDNHIYHWEAGDQAATDAAFARADRVVSLSTHYPRSHPAPLETCGIVADVNPATGKATLYMTSQAPHAVRTVFALVAGLPEHQIRVISPDLGGGFGNKVPVYPGYVIATAASLLLGHPVKWVEDRNENLISTGFARDFHMTGELALDSGGRMLALRVHVDSDNGAFYADAQPSKFKAGLFHIVTGSYDIPAAHVTADGFYTNKAPGGVAYRSSFRVTEASYLIERLVTNAALEISMDQAEIRLRNFIPPEAFPYHSATGWEYDSGNYEAAMNLALEKVGYSELRREQAELQARGELMGIGLASFTEVVGAGPGRDFDILGLRMFDSAELRVHPTGKAVLKLGVKTQGQGHETTFAQIVAEELGIPAADVEVQHGDTDNTPYGLGTYASRSTSVAGEATAVVSGKLREKARSLAAHLLEVSEDDLEWERGRFFVHGSPDRTKTIQDCAFAAYTNLPEGMEAGLEGVSYYDPPNMTYPFGTYAVVVDVDKGTGVVKVRKVVAVDDCGVRINPMIVEGQIHGGLTEGFGIAFTELITFDSEGNCVGSNFMDYLLPTSWETPRFECFETVTPSPQNRLGAKGVGNSATVGSPAAYVNAVIDALAPHGITNIDMPVTSDKVWEALRSKEVPAAMPSPPTEIELDLGEERREPERVVAPRALNAGFREVDSALLRGPFQALRAGAAYDLLVDIGPRWTRIPSLVTGLREFPEEVLSQEHDGFLVQIVLVSEDFSPSMVEAGIWVPARAGRSHPIIDGAVSGLSGPVSLRVTAPSIPDVVGGVPQTSVEVHGRLNLYYANNLLQSAMVRVTVSNDVTLRPLQRNVIAVDYVLSAAFQDVPQTFSPRELSIAMNSDGGPRHRIVVRADGPTTEGTRCPPQGWTDYDPKGASDLLTQAREALLACSCKLGESGELAPTIDLATNRRTKDDFWNDLTRLAALGSSLFQYAFDDVELVNSDCSTAEWQHDLVSRLARSSVIQIARTGPAQYVFPWALVYEYPLYEADRNTGWKTCRIIREWAEDGSRKSDPDDEPDQCPYANFEWHQKNIVCPYGFWGLKHVVEEPLVRVSKIKDAARRIRTGTPIGLSTALTGDPRLVSDIELHMGRVRKLPGLNLTSAAQSWSDVCAILKAPEFVYFLCHCNDDENQKPYLGIGVNARIYADDISKWAHSRQGPDLEAWRMRGPLVLINGCHTGALKPGQILSFVKSFAGMWAGGIVATEVNVLLPVAAEIAESLLARLAGPVPQPIGRALRAVRWQLANKGNLSGLAYTLYAMAELQVERDAI